MPHANPPSGAAAAHVCRRDIVTTDDPAAGAAVRLVCVDVDGTLVGSTGQVHPSVWPAVERLRTNGARLSVCSGRPAFGASLAYAKRLDSHGWHSFQNGASIVHLASGRTLSTRLPADSVELLVRRARSTGRLLELYSDLAYAFEVDSPLARAHAALLGVSYQPRSFQSLAGPVVRAQWVLPDAGAAEALAESYPGLEISASTSPVMPGTQFLNITAAGVDKGSAVRALAAEYGLTPDLLMFVGDGMNDVPAMRLVGHPVAMGNAAPAVKEAAASVVGLVDDGGLAEALELALAPATGRHRAGAPAQPRGWGRTGR